MNPRRLPRLPTAAGARILTAASAKKSGLSRSVRDYDGGLDPEDLRGDGVVMDGGTIGAAEAGEGVPAHAVAVGPLAASMASKMLARVLLKKPRPGCGRDDSGLRVGLAEENSEGERIRSTLLVVPVIQSRPFASNPTDRKSVV